MRKPTILVAAVAACAVSLAGAGYALGGGSGVIWDDGHPAQPGSLDDGKELLPRTTVTLAAAVADAQTRGTGSARTGGSEGARRTRAVRRGRRRPRGERRRRHGRDRGNRPAELTVV